MTVTIHLQTTPPTDLYTLSLHDALPIWLVAGRVDQIDDRLAWLVTGADPADGEVADAPARIAAFDRDARVAQGSRSEEHTSELQSPYDLVCRLLLEKKKNNHKPITLPVQ